MVTEELYNKGIKCRGICYYCNEGVDNCYQYITDIKGTKYDIGYIKEEKMKDKIYVSHSTKFDFKNELYKPLKESKLNELYELILPHENSSELYNSKEGLKHTKYIIADVSIDSVGVGIELGWGNLYENIIICVYKKGSKPSQSLMAVSSIFLEYENEIELIEQLTKYIKTIP